jgi:signal peptidase I
VQTPLHLLTTVAELGHAGGAVVTVVTGSMQPVVMRGARVVLRRCRAGVLRVGDPVVFLRADGAPCLHRVVGWHGDGRLRTRGDGNTREDGPVAPERVIGTVQGLAFGWWQWRGAPRMVQRGVRRVLLPALPWVRAVMVPARAVRRWARRA